MSSLRLTLLCAFAGGCLSNALLFGIWRMAEGSGDPATKQAPQSHNVAELVTPTVAAPSVAQPTELVALSAAGHARDVAIEAAPAPVAADLDSAGPSPAGSAVSDVLMRLEAAYRERGAAPAPAQASLTQDREIAAAPTDNAVAAAKAAPSAPTQPVPAVVPVTLAVAPASQVTAPATLATQAAASPAALPPQTAGAPASAAQEAPPPTVVQYGDVNQNTYITNVREGDVYQIQMQQLAVLQYMQLLGMSGAAAPARRGGVAGRQQRGALSSGITNPDNPWGFRFAPLNLVR